MTNLLRTSNHGLLKNIILMLTFLPFVGVGGMFGNALILHALQILSSVILTVAILTDLRHFKITSLHIVLVLFSIYELFAALYNGTVSFGILFAIYFRFISIVYIIKSYQKKDYAFIRSLSWLLNILLIINLPSIFGSLNLPEYQKVFLLGGKNSLAIVAVSSMFFNYLNTLIFSSKISKWGYLIMALDLITLFLSGSSTGMFVGIIMLLFVFLGEHFNIRFRYYVLVYAVFLCFIFNTKLIENIPFLYNYITGSLNKNLTFTGRTAIWDHSLHYISNNFFGYGRGNDIIVSFTGTVSECHNAFLELLLASGIPGLVLFIVFLFDCVDTRGKKMKNKALNICFFAIFAILVLGLTESVINSAILWWIMAITFCENKIREGQN